MPNLYPVIDLPNESDRKILVSKLYGIGIRIHGQDGLNLENDYCLYFGKVFNENEKTRTNIMLFRLNGSPDAAILSPTAECVRERVLGRTLVRMNSIKQFVEYAKQFKSI